MEYTFSWNWFFIGMVILAAGSALIVWYRPIADNMGGGVMSYDRYRLWGLVACAVGLVVMLNLHAILLQFLIGGLFQR